MVQAYCVKCRSEKEMKDSKAITMKNGKPATSQAYEQEPIMGTLPKRYISL